MMIGEENKKVYNTTITNPTATDFVLILVNLSITSWKDAVEKAIILERNSFLCPSLFTNSVNFSFHASIMDLAFSIEKFGID